jgi:predicted nucleic acid-binding protein
VFDVNALVQAIASGNRTLADCLGVINDAAEFALFLSPHILSTTSRVLITVVGTPKEDADEHLELLVEMAEASGGGVLVPPRTVHDCRDHDDKLILDLAAEVGALLVVSEHADLTTMSPWRGVPILRADEFITRVDAMRRHVRRR